MSVMVRGRSALSIVELVVSAGLTALLAAIAYNVWISAERARERISMDVDVQTRYSIVQERLVREMRRSFGFSRGDGPPGASVRFAVRDEPNEKSVEVRFRRPGRLTRVVAGREEVLGPGLPLEEVRLDLDAPDADGSSRVATIRTRLAWKDASGRAESLDLVTSVTARNRAGCAALFEGEVE